MKNILFIILFLVSVQTVQSQNEDLPPTRSIYAELGGPGLPYSLNYDFRFDKTKINSWGMRVGAGGYALDGNSFFSVPVMVNRLLGKGPHYFEVGFGATFMAYNQESYYYTCDSGSGGDQICNKTTYDRSYNFILPVDGSPSVMGTMNFGYRRIPVDGGFTWKVNLNPIFNNNGFWPLFAGIGIGYAF
jgi:hypothetical protein